MSRLCVWVILLMILCVCVCHSQSLYENWFIALYTVFYTSMPVQCLAIFERVRDAFICDRSFKGCTRLRLMRPPRGLNPAHP